MAGSRCRVFPSPFLGLAAQAPSRLQQKEPRYLRSKTCSLLSGLEVTLRDLSARCFSLGSSQAELPREALSWPRGGQLPGCGASPGWVLLLPRASWCWDLHRHALS